MYDNYGQLVEEVNNTLDKTFKYEYNGIGNIESVTTYSHVNGVPSTNGTTVSFGYDTTMVEHHKHTTIKETSWATLLPSTIQAVLSKQAMLTMLGVIAQLPITPTPILLPQMLLDTVATISIPKQVGIFSTQDTILPNGVDLSPLMIPHILTPNP